jgi:thiol-disulfide isomerase/thioredoxin
MERLYYALAGAIVIFVALTVYRYYFQAPIIEEEAFTDGGAGAPAYTFVMFGVDWCPHCVKAKPEFEALGSTQTIGGKVVQMKVINPETDENPYKESVKISGYPTVVLLAGAGKATEYEGARTTAGFQQFLEQQVQ